MANKAKRAAQSSKSIIDFGKARKERIEDFRAKRRVAKSPIPTQEEAVNMLVDIALEKEGV